MECAPLVRLCAAKAYHCACREVIVDWRDDCVERQRYLMADESVFDEYSERDRISYDIGLAENAALLEFYSSDPNMMDGVDPSRVMRARRAKMAKVSPIYQRIYDKTAVQCTAAPPILSWAKKAFPRLPENEALTTLWDKVFKTLRIDGMHDAVQQWQLRFAEMQKQIQMLNALHLQSLHYHNAQGTDISIQLPKDHEWHSCLSRTKSGVTYAMNLPSEEIYTVPIKNGVDGIVYGSIPLVYQGFVIKNYYLRFENGKVVETGAEEGADKLQALIGFDEGASYLGEVALVPNDSAIRKSGTLFYNPLYDENASCHFALGMGLGECIRGGESMSQEELTARGVNQSKIHVDFMIGTDDMSITGTTDCGRELPIFVAGSFAAMLFS